MKIDERKRLVEMMKAHPGLNSFEKLHELASKRNKIAHEFSGSWITPEGWQLSTQFVASELKPPITADELVSILAIYNGLLRKKDFSLFETLPALPPPAEPLPEGIVEVVEEEEPIANGNKDIPVELIGLIQEVHVEDERERIMRVYLKKALRPIAVGSHISWEVSKEGREMILRLMPEVTKALKWGNGTKGQSWYPSMKGDTLTITHKSTGR